MDRDVDRRWRATLPSYFSLLRKHLWAVGVGVVGAALGIISVVVDTFRSPPGKGQPAPGPLVPTWLWASLLIGGALAVHFRMFHDMRLQRDESANERDAIKDELGSHLQRATDEGHTQVLKGMVNVVQTCINSKT